MTTKVSKLSKEQKEKRDAIRDNITFRIIGNRAWSKVNQLERTPLPERQEARRDWISAMQNPAMIEERISWLFNGSYGEEAYYAAIQIVCMNAGANKVAHLGALLAGLDWNCPPSFARDGWKRLTTKEQLAVNEAVERAAIDGFNSEVLGIDS